MECESLFPPEFKIFITFETNVILIRFVIRHTYLIVQLGLWT